MDKLNVLVLFGGRSPEHEVSIISGIQVLNALNKSKYNPIPVYITKDGDWLLGDSSYYNVSTFSDLSKTFSKSKSVMLVGNKNFKGLIIRSGIYGLLPKKIEIDIAIPVFHGRYGEDGSIQGLFELFDIPYVGCGVLASSVGMDKILSKNIAKSIGIPILKGNWIAKEDWKGKKASVDQLMYGLKFPVFVKPANLGSTIGIIRAKNNSELKDAVNVGFFYDKRVLVENALSGPREINISIIGSASSYELSACEEPIRSQDLLSFADKYIGEGKSKGMATAKRIVPAKIKQITKNTIERYSKAFFREINGDGIARIDYLLSKDEKSIYFNEINTMPGSLSFYLWKETGLGFDKLLDKLVNLAQIRKQADSSLTTTFKSNILEGFNGVKRSKI